MTRSSVQQKSCEDLLRNRRSMSTYHLLYKLKKIKNGEQTYIQASSLGRTSQCVAFKRESPRRVGETDIKMRWTWTAPVKVAATRQF